MLCPALLINAQTKDNVKKKLKDLKGEASKITIKTDEGEVTFEGDEADYLLRKMKRDVKERSFSFMSPDEDFLVDMDAFDFKMPHLPKGFKFYGNLEDFDADSGDFNFKFPHAGKINIFKNSDDYLSLLHDFNKKITIEKEDGETKVTVKRMKNGDEITETYKGEEAEKFLDKLNDEEPVSFDFKMKDKDSDKKEPTIIIIK